MRKGNDSGEAGQLTQITALMDLSLYSQRSRYSQRAILLSLSDYLELADYTGRFIHPEKRGPISNQQPPILKRPGLTTEE